MELLRELMALCDKGLQSFRQEGETPPAFLEELDEKIWQWFSETNPPAPSELKTIFEKFQSSDFASESDEAESSPCSDDFSSTDFPTESEAPKNSELSDSVAMDNDGEEVCISIQVENEILDDFLSEAHEILGKVDLVLEKLEEKVDPKDLEAFYRYAHTLKGGLAFCEITPIVSIFHHLEDFLGGWKNSPPDFIPKGCMGLIQSCMEFLREALSQLGAIAHGNTEKREVILSSKLLSILETDLNRALRGETDGFLTQRASARKTTGDEEFIHLRVERVNDAVNMVGELGISFSALARKMTSFQDAEIEILSNQVEKIMGQLHHQVMGMRLVPAGRLFRKFRRIVSNLASELGKEIRLELLGMETELDKLTLDALYAPALHIVRNSLDHGLENPEERLQKGKSASGLLRIRVYQEGRHIFIEFEDDGRGLDHHGIRRKAIEKGLILEKDSLSEEEVFRLIFQPGFSTIEKATNLSGRGVGMDVVAQEIQRLRGNVSLRSQKDQGTILLFQLPLTTAMINALRTEVGGIPLLFPAGQVKELIQSDEIRVYEVPGKGQVLRLREEVFSFFRGRKIFKTSGMDGEGKIEEAVVLILNLMGRKVGIQVDRVLEQQQVVIKELRAFGLEDESIFTGGAVLDDGSVGLVVNIEKLLDDLATSGLSVETLRGQDREEKEALI